MSETELSGWKEIATYLRKSVRTAQRYERELGLPVRRLPPPSADVHAMKGEVDEWKRRMPAAANDIEEDQDKIDVGGRISPADAAGRPAPGVQSIRPPLARTSILIGVLFLIAAGAWLLWGGPRPSTTDPPRTSRQTVQKAAPVLAPSPWPTFAHDMQRTAHSSLAGPRHPATPTLLYEVASGDANDSIVALVATPSDAVVAGSCGSIFGLDREGHKRWQTPLEARPFTITETRLFRRDIIVRMRPMGITADLNGSLWTGGTECGGDVPGSLRTGLLQCMPNSPCALVPEGSAYAGPAIGPDRTLYTLDETCFLRAHASWGEQRWAVDLPGFSNRGVAINAKGVIFAGTDGGKFGQASLWAVGPDGRIRWKALDDAVGLPVIGPDDRVYVAGWTGSGLVYGFTSDGRPLWTLRAGPISSLAPLAICPSGTLYVHATDEVVAIKPDGTIAWRFEPGTGSTGDASLVLDRDENVYAAVGDFVYSLTAHGKQRWRVPLKAPGAIIMGGEGVLYAVSDRTRIYAIADAPADAQPPSRR